MNICCHCHGTLAGLYVSHKRHIIPGSEFSWVRKFQEARRPRSESSREQIGQGPIGRFAPGSELGSCLNYVWKFVLIADWSVANFVAIDDDNEMGHRPISYQDEFSRII